MLCHQRSRMHDMQRASPATHLSCTRLAKSMAVCKTRTSASVCSKRNHIVCAGTQGDKQGEAATVHRRQLISGAAGLVLGCGCAACAAKAAAAGQQSSWYQKYFAWAMANQMSVYEAAIAPVKEQLFKQLFQQLVTGVQGTGVQDEQQEASSSSGTAGQPALQILEVGIGTGPNLSYMTRAAATASTGSSLPLVVTGVEPNIAMHDYTRQAAEQAGLSPSQLQLVGTTGTELPFPDASFDAAVITLVLCSVDQPQLAVSEITRVLKPGGHLLFIEHVGARFSEAPLIAAAQVLLEPLQMAMADGCHLTRKTGELLRQETCWASLQLTEDSVPGLGLLAPHVWGLAKRA